MAGNGVREVIGPAAAAFDRTGGGEPVPGEGGYGGEEQWVARLRERDPAKPFFAWLASHDAHRIWDAAEFAGRHDPAAVTVPPSLCDTPETRRDLAQYYDEIGRLDFYVGEVVAELARQGVLEETWIVFLADHGRPFPRAKTQLYEEGVRTPLIVVPAVGWGAGAGVVDALVSTIDLAPTVLELAGVARPATFQGVSLVPVLREPKAVVREVVFAEQNWHNFPAHVRLVRTGDWAYLRNAWPERRLPGASDTFYNPSAEALKAGYAAGTLTAVQANPFWSPRPAEELYDLAVDPAQAVNRAAGGSGEREWAQLTVMRALLERWTKETGDTVPTCPTVADTDMVTGAKFGPVRHGEPTGAAGGALRRNAPGPVRLREVGV
jgi:arylsulfatase